MNGIETESILNQISPDAPSGESDLSSEPAFIDLEILIEGTPEREFGGKIVQEAKDPNWRDVRKSALTLLTRTHDLRVVMHLTRAMLHTDGFEGFASGLGLLHGLVERYWDSLYPQLDPDDNNDPIQRINILAALSEGEDILVPLRKTDLCASRQLGKYCYRDVLIASGRIDATKNDKTPPPKMVEIEAAFKDSDVEDLLAKKTSIKAALENLDKLKAELNNKVGEHHSGSIPDFKSLSEALTEMDAIMEKHLQGREPEQLSNPDSVAAVDESNNAQSADSGIPPSYSPSSGINSRRDVIRLLDEICKYYHNFEPGSPVPMLLKRARQLVEKNFIEIIQDLAPDSADKIKNLIAGDDNEGS